MLLITFIIIVLTALIAGALVSAFAPEDVATANPSTGDAVELSHDGDEEPDQWGVSPTTGNAVLLSGEDSYVSAELQENVSTGPWTMCSWARLDDDANLDATMDVAAADNGSILIQYDAGEWLAYGDNGTHDAVATAPASSPTTPTTVCGRSNGTAVELFVDGDQKAASNLSTNTSSRNVSVSWDGAIDETRVSNSSVATGTISTYADKPTIPFNNTDRVGRFMLDEGSGSTSTVYFSPTDATLVNAKWTSGVPRRTLESGSDYRIDWSTWEITALAGGDIDGAPIVYVYYANGVGVFTNAVTSINSQIGNALILFGTALLVIPGVALIRYLVDNTDNIVRNDDWGRRR